MTKVPVSVTRGSDASGPASQFSSLSSHSPSLKSRTFLTGRGGAGNIQHHPPSERAIFSFDEELERQLSQERHAAPVYHVGRGGAGNAYGRPQDVRAERYLSGFCPDRRKSDDSESQKSCESGSGSGRSDDRSGAAFATGKVKKGWKKITGGY